MHVKLGVCNICTPGAGAFAAKFTVESGLDGMSIDFGFKANGYPLASRKLQEAYLDMQQKFGIEYPNIVMSCFDYIPLLAEEEDADYCEIQWVLKTAVVAAKYMRIPLILVPTFNKSEIRTDQDYECAVKVFQKLCDMAGENGITIASENVLEPKRQIELFIAVDRSNFGIFYDSENFFFNRGWSQVNVLEKIYDIIVPQIHVKDGLKGELSARLLGEGESGFYGTLDVLKSRNYNGWIILENYYDQLPLRARYDDVYDIFYSDIQILKTAVNSM